ncbi:MAG: hypothetical protein SCALA702_00650 [Melioribacteraceae bacterium]|nr:MAG: hypothetical protein SCALA702_00650 [Melioribacteraceae bacterium]
MNSDSNTTDNSFMKERVLLYVIALLPLFGLLSLLLLDDYIISIILGWLGIPLAFYDRSQIKKDREKVPGILATFFYPIYLFKRLKLAGAVFVIAYVTFLFVAFSYITNNVELEDTAKNIINEHHNVYCIDVDIYKSNGDIHYANAELVNGEILGILISQEGDYVRVRLR